jgi:3-oxoadipate enol-lactonase
MPKVQANDIDIYFEIKGAGEPLLLIAGFASDLTIWSKMVSPLAEQYRVIVFDNRGIGRSSAPDSPYTIRQMAEDTVGLLNEIGVDKAHVAGHSMGGMIGQELVLAHPEKVESLILLATCAKPDERNQAIIESWGELPRQVDPATAARLSLPWIYTSNFYSRPKAVQQVIEMIVKNPVVTPMPFRSNH